MKPLSGHVRWEATQPLEAYRACRLCPRRCGVDRMAAVHSGKTGFCGETDQLRVAHVGPHFGEEPPVSGRKGSGAVFFSGCTLRCTFCQNHQISRGGQGEAVSLEHLWERVKEMIRVHQVHNLNLVTPDHFLPHALTLVARQRAEGLDVPVVFNLSGYQSPEWLDMAGSGADIYLADFKYGDARLAARLSSCGEYPETALDAISEMVRQKGFLDTFSSGAEIAKKGVLVRHLILPGYVQNSMDALSSLFLEFGKDLPLSLMSQYYPVVKHKDARLNRTLTHAEFHQVYAHVRALGFRNLFVQFPEKTRRRAAVPPALVPDFRKAAPFG